MSDVSRGRRLNLGKQIPEKWLIIAGDCHLINEYLETNSGKSVLLIFEYLNSILRSFGQVIFANNPISGLLIMIGIASANYRAMFAALLTSSLAFLFAKLLQQDVLGNLNGFFGYNAVLHAVVSIGYLPSIYESIAIDEPKFWMFLFFTTLISVYFTTAFANLFRYLFHYPIPCFTLPFNILQYLLIFCILNNSIPPKILSPRLLEPSIKSNLNNLELVTPAQNDSIMSNLSSYSVNGLLRRKRNENEGNEIFVEDISHDQKWQLDDFEKEIKNSSLVVDENLMNKTHLHWGETFSGTITALSQVYGLNDIPCSILMFLALIIYSPTTALFCYSGSFVGTLVGVILSSNFEKVYNGMWGYNGLLCGGALAGFGFVLTPQSAFLALIATLFCTVFQHFITPLFTSIGVPIFHIPFLVTTTIFLLVTSDAEKALPRPGNYTYPEKHRYDFKKECKENLEGYLRRARISEA